MRRIKTKGWHGSSTVGTDPASYFFTRSRADLSKPATEKDYGDFTHEAQFRAVLDKLQELAETSDGNGWPIVEFVYTDIRARVRNPVVAYRFTSDWAYHKYYSEVQALGTSLGRGIFEVLGGDPSAVYHRELWCAQQEEGVAS